MEKKSEWLNKGGDLSLHKPTGVYYVRKSFKRLKLPNLFKTTGETSLYKAKAKSIDIIKAHLDVHLHKVRLVSEIIDEFIRVETNSEKRRTRTQENHKIYYAQLRQEWGDKPIATVDEVSWSDWLSGFRKRRKRKTYNDYAVYMNMLLRYAYKRKYVSHLVKLPLTDAKRETGRVLTQDEIERLSNAMSGDTLDQFYLAYECCMRLREALYLRWEQLDLNTGLITLSASDVKTGSRTGKGRQFYVTETTLERLRERYGEAMKAKEVSPYVFPSPLNPKHPVDQNKTAWIAAKRRAGIKGKCRWHDIRHTALSNMIMKHKMPIADVSEFAGVSVRTLQKVYLHSRPEQTKSVAVLRVVSKKV